jgi:transposase
MAIIAIGMDLAKNVFAVHGVNDAGKPELVRPSVPRAKLHEFIATECTVLSRLRSPATTPCCW